MAKIKIENLAEDLLVTIDGHTANLYDKSRVSFSIDNYILKMNYDEGVVFTEETKNITPKEVSPRDLLKLLRSFLVAPVVPPSYNGFFDYADLATQSTPINITGGAGFTQLTNDTLGSFTTREFAPAGIDDIWNSTTNSFDFSQLKKGDEIFMRIDIDVVISSVNTEVALELFAGLSNPFEVIFVGERNYKNTGTYKISQFNGVYIGSNDVLNNAAYFKFKADKNCTVKVNGWYCRIFRR